MRKVTLQFFSDVKTYTIKITLFESEEVKVRLYPKYNSEVYSLSKTSII